MTEAQRRTIEVYCRDKLLPFLGLHEWEVDVLPGTTEEDECFADTSYGRGSPLAFLRLGPKFWTASRERRTATLLHEMLHLVTAHEHHLVDDFGEAMGPAGAAFKKAWDLAAEYRIDRLATALVPLAPPLPTSIAR